MSLLLDALKKAAKEKEEADNASPAGTTPADEPSSAEPTAEVPADEGLSLDPEPAADPSEPADTQQPIIEETPDAEPELILEEQEVRRETSTVSDEALQMLVHKTNREHRRRQKTVWLSVTLTAVLILLVEGYYFYSEMVTDVEALERKHRIALQKVNAEVIKRKDPELIAGLTNNTAEPAAATDESRTAESVSSLPVARKEPTARASAPASQAEATSAVNVSSRVKQDPIGEQLQAGWSAYNEGDYVRSQQNYQSVLEREPDNRDALLGLAAIAVANGDDTTAMRHYAQLLRLDPQDPIAAPALSSLRGRELDGLDESSLKSLLKRNPEAHQASFALGNIKAAENNWPQAQAYYFDAWRTDPSNADYAFNIAVSLDNLGKQTEAAEFYRRSLSLSGQRSHSFSQDAVRTRLQQLER